jgi:predicted RNA-binding Zn-ribbon protein involved in translation (DUF1610 family)
MNETTCPECGERNVGRPEFCAACGAFLAWDDETSATPAAAAPQTAGAVSSGPVAAARSPRAAAGSATTQSAAPVAAPPSAAMSAPAAGATGTQPVWMGAGAAVAPAWHAPTAAPPPEPGPPPDRQCPACGVHNDAALRFCRKCGHPFVAPTLTDSGPAVVATPERIPWWRKWYRATPGTTRAARVAYRQSMPWIYRARRYLWGLLGIGVLVGSLALLGRDPIGWVSARWQDLRGDVVQVQGVTAVTEPTAGGSPEFPAGNLVDNLSDTAWATAFTVENLAAAGAVTCVAPAAQSPQGVPASAVLISPEPVTVRSISVVAGLPESDQRRLWQWRPKTLQLGFSDGTCQRVALADTPALQESELEPVETTQIRVSVVDAYPPVPDQPIDLAALTEIRLFARP